MKFSKRSVDNEDDLEGEVSLIAMLYIRLYTDLINNPDPDLDVSNEANNLHNALSPRGNIQEKVSSVIKNKLMSILLK